MSKLNDVLITTDWPTLRVVCAPNEWTLDQIVQRVNVIGPKGQHSWVLPSEGHLAEYVERFRSEPCVDGDHMRHYLTREPAGTENNLVGS